jgi:hypothetical protein
MDVRLPDGTIITNVPEGITKAELMARVGKLNGLSTQSKIPEKADGSLFDPLIEGLTLGWKDELGGLGARLGGYLAGAGPERRDEMARAEMERQRAALSAAREESPWLSMGAEIGGSLMPGGLLARGAKTGWELARQGAGLGALAGMGAADENKELGAVTGGAVGGILGGAIPAATAAVRHGVGAGWDWASNLGRRMAEAPETRAGGLLSDMLQGAGITPAALRSAGRQLGPEATVAEAAGEAGQMLGQALVGKGDPTGQARLKAARELGKRVPGMTGRLRETIGQVSGVSARLQPSLDAVRARQQELSGPLYEQAYAQEIPLTGALKNLLRRKKMRKAFKKAIESADTRGEDLPPWFKMNDLNEWEKVGVMPDMRAWDHMKQGVDRLIDKQIDPITGRVSKEGSDLLAMKHELLKELDDINPIYAAARQTFAGDEAIQSAMRNGERFLSMKTREVATLTDKYTRSEREAFLTGAVEAMREKIGRARSGEIGSFKFLESENAMEKLRYLMPPGREGTRALALLNRNLRKERVMRETQTALLQGSQTGPREAAAAMLGSQASMPTAAEVMASPVRAGTQGVLSKGISTLSRERQPTIDRLTDLVLEPGQIDAVIAEMQRRGIPEETIRAYLNSFTRGSAALAPAGGLAAGGTAE